MRVTKAIKLGNLVVDRWPLNPTTLALVDYLKGGGQVPPIHVQPQDNGTYKVLDGRHRALAYKLLGRDTIDCTYGVRKGCE
jgi:uncharacterized ParB-like nuclease family protein